MNETTRELPRYKCHKEVHGLKIEKIVVNRNGSLDVSFELEGFEPINLVGDVVPRFAKSGNDDLGYYVVYEDGYISWSPTEAFENGYTRIEQ